MQSHQERVIAERDDLQGKVERLARFFDTSIFASFSPSEQDRMVRQLEHMNSYRDVLNERIAAFT